MLWFIFSAAYMKGMFDRVLCDPPFLSSDCQAKSERPPAIRCGEAQAME